MRVRGPSTLNLWSSVAVCLTLTACAVKPVESPPVASHDNDCGTANPLHRVSSEPTRAVDPAIESVLNQRPGDPRLIQINRQMYQSLRALDAELLRESGAAACKQAAQTNSTLEAQSTAGAGSSSVPSSPNPQSSLAVAAAGASGASQSGSARKATVSPNGAAGNGATAPKIVPGSDNEIIARRLRKAAEEEKDPALRAKLWKEYKEYQATAAAR